MPDTDGAHIHFTGGLPRTGLGARDGRIQNTNPQYVQMPQDVFCMSYFSVLSLHCESRLCWGLWTCYEHGLWEQRRSVLLAPGSRREATRVRESTQPTRT